MCALRSNEPENQQENTAELYHLLRIFRNCRRHTLHGNSIEGIQGTLETSHHPVLPWGLPYSEALDSAYDSSDGSSSLDSPIRRLPTSSCRQSAGQPGTFEIYSRITIYERDPISSFSRVYNADLCSDIIGTMPIIVKLTPLGPKYIREARIHFSVPHHKNVVERIATDTFNFRGQPSIFIAMERCDCNLFDHIKYEVENKIAFDSEKYTWINYQVLLGLDFLHSQNVIHGDLKPPNVLLKVNGNIAKLSDFGLSRTLRENHDSTQLTSPQGGTNGWLGPEILEGTTRISKATDIFPCGLVFHFTWSHGKHPYGDRVVSQNHYILEGINRDLSTLRVVFIDQATALLERMFRHNPYDRPTTREILRDPIFRNFGSYSEARVEDAQVADIFSEAITLLASPTSEANLKEGSYSEARVEDAQVADIFSEAITLLASPTSEANLKEDKITPLGITPRQIVNALRLSVERNPVSFSKLIEGFQTSLDDCASDATSSPVHPNMASEMRVCKYPKRAFFGGEETSISSARESKGLMFSPPKSFKSSCSYDISRTSANKSFLLLSWDESDKNQLQRLSSEIDSTQGVFIFCDGESSPGELQTKLALVPTCTSGINTIVIAHGWSTRPLAKALEEHSLLENFQNNGLALEEAKEKIARIRRNLAVFTFAPMPGNLISSDVAQIAINILMTAKCEGDGLESMTSTNEKKFMRAFFYNNEADFMSLSHFLKNPKVIEFMNSKTQL